MPDNDGLTFGPPDTPPDQGEEGEDYVFRFRLDPTAQEAGYDDPLLELIRGQLADLLDTVTLTDHGRPVRVDGFRLLQDPDAQYDIFPKRSPGGEAAP